MAARAHIIVLLAFFCFAGSSCSGAAGGSAEDSTPCTPGTVDDCTCGADGPAGTRVCDVAKGLWGQCVCEAADVGPGEDGTDPADGGPGPVGPGPGTAAQSAALTSGAAELASGQYRLRILVGPVTPVQYVESEQYRLKLGVGLSK